jgi:hypothetical protein
MAQHNQKTKTAGESKSADPFIDLPGIDFAIDTIQAWNGVVNALYVFVMQYWWIFQFVLYWLAQHAVKSLLKKLCQRLTGSETIQKPVIFNEGINLYKLLEKLGGYKNYGSEWLIKPANEILRHRSETTVVKNK